MGLELNQYQIQKKLDDAYHSHPGQFFTRGEKWYVDPANGDDNAGGKDIWTAVQTIQKALTLIAAKRTASSKTYHEYIYLLPGQGTDYDDDTVGASLANAYVYINISDVSIIGCGRPGDVVVKPDAAATAGIFALGTSADRIEIANIHFDSTTAANGMINAASGGCDDVWIHHCAFDGQGGAASVGINTANAATCARWTIEYNRFIDRVTGSVIGYLGLGIIRYNTIIKTIAGALTIGISLLDNTTTADSDGAVIHDNLVLGGINGTTPLADGISVAANCYGVGVWRNGIAGCTDNLTITENTAGAHAIDNYTYDQGEGNVAYATVDDKLPG